MSEEPTSNECTTPTHERDERGYVLVLTALISIALLIFAAIGVDVGAFYSRGIQAQRAADAAATAGVVYLPGDLARAEQAALQAARDNGFDDNDPKENLGKEIDVIVQRGNTPRRLKVTIRDRKVETYFAQFFQSSINLGRVSTAEYVNKIALGSAFNSIGTGSLSSHTPSGALQNFWLSVNGYCTAKEDGDQRLSRFDGNRSRANPDVYHCSTSGDPNAAGPPSTNTEFTANGSYYDYVIDVPCTRPDPSVDCDPNLAAPAPVTVQVYNAAFDLSEQTQSETGFAPGYVANPASPRPDTRTLFRRNNPSGWRDADFIPRWDNTQVTTVFEVHRPTTDSNLWLKTDPANPTVVSPVPPDPNGPQPPPITADRSFGTCDDDPVTPRRACTAAESGWTTLTVLPNAGRWKIRVYTLSDEPNSYGVNSFALRAFTGGSFGPCDTRISTSCPGVSGDVAMSVLAKSSNPGATEFFLSRLAPADEFRGKRIQVNLWDAGEGMSRLEIIDPLGRITMFDCDLGPRKVTGPLEAVETADPSGCPTTSLAVDSGAPQNPVPWTNGDSRFNSKQFNDRMLQLLIDLPTDYGLDGSGNPLAGFDGWWKIRYTPAGSGTVYDRSTWSVEVVGDPVHIIPT
jgi:hypothetical protein